jgi:4-hydroxy-tetrahydrodipicolinate reductase
MKIALLGYGKMGKAIEQVALAKGHQIVLRKTQSNSFDALDTADVAIDFSVPGAAVANITAALKAGIPIVSGTTGWLDDYAAMVNLCEQNNGSFIYGSNFSLGVNLFFELNQYLAKLMVDFPEYKISMKEIHHTQKLDAPSGTALSLAKQIIDCSDYSSWALSDAADHEIMITAERTENVPGTHSIFYDSPIDSIEITHTAHSRQGFADGAVRAAEWLIGKRGVYSMRDVLGFDNKTKDF